jgi:hypothetical protein
MDKDHEDHLARIKTTVAELIDTKYRAGQKEHGGTLWLKPGLLDEAINEVIDLAVYLLTLKEQIDNVVKKYDSLAETIKNEPHTSTQKRI